MFIIAVILSSIAFLLKLLQSGDSPLFFASILISINELTYGVFHPVILMPKQTDWKNINQLRYIFSHEYVHIYRFDTIAKLIATYALCIHWFNPLVWVMYILFNRDIELACDESVIRQFGDKSKSAYSLMLISIIVNIRCAIFVMENVCAFMNNHHRAFYICNNITCVCFWVIESWSLYDGEIMEDFPNVGNGEANQVAYSLFCLKHKTVRFPEVL